MNKKLIISLLIIVLTFVAFYFLLKYKPMEKISKNGDVLSMNYTGRLVDGTVFDSNVDPKFGHVQPFEFKLGSGMVIKGWDEGLVSMKVGEKKTLTIAPEKAYGAAGIPPVIPANATLIFDVELTGIK
ncbi:MAG: FKBP-type peptidyl-prolyl cis-trans isomerase [Candidatus Nomurabacteria bacterium]|nr:FKBP-type peptidyl-prolyl cis-trans isomerase [Candidatus Nomurabacteria bacterium]